MSRRGSALYVAALIGITGCSTADTADLIPTTMASSPPAAASATTATSGATGSDLDDMIRQIASGWYGSADIGGAVAAVGTPDGAVHVAAIGQSSPGLPATGDDVMRTGSITKTFTATLATRLARRGLIDLDTPVADYLPSLGLAPEVTTRTLLNHTSGITDPGPDELIAQFRADPAHRFSVQELLTFAHLPTEAVASSSEFVYANANYHLAALLIEHATGRDFADVLRTEILDTAGLEHTYLVGFEPLPEPVVPGNVDLNGDGTEDSLADIPYLAVDTYSWSAGAIATTAADLVAFARALFDGTLLDDTGLAELTDRSQAGEHPLGLVQFDINAWAHNGGAPGYRALFVHQPDRGVTAAIFTNCPSCATGDPEMWQPVADLLATVSD
jgi:D-alanyl-D-alanine carboxypeptidase